MEEEHKKNQLDKKFSKVVEKIQKQIRKGSWTYLCRHPEIRAIIRVIIVQAMEQNPSDFIKFTADFFNCKNTPSLIAMINEQLKRVNDQLKRGRWSEFDGEMFFTESSESSQSLKSKTSSVSPILTYALIDDECDL